MIGAGRCLDLPRHIDAGALRLRPLHEGDAEAMFTRWAADAQVTRYLAWATHQSVADSSAFLAEVDLRWSNGTEHCWGIELDDAGLVGSIGAAVRGHAAMLGYVIGRPWWGRGVVSTASQAVVDALVAEGSVRRIWAYAHHEHRASLRVMEKVGMTFEGTVKGGGLFPGLGGAVCDCALYGMVV